jgi:DNA-binding response OmpR family regulator
MEAPARIVIVEDEILTTRYLASRVEELGYELVACSSEGEEAVGLVASLKPDLVIMDIMLSSDLSGLEAAKRIRVFSPVPLVFVTGYSDADIRERALALGAVDFLTKPLNMREFQRTLRAALARFHVARI